MLPILPVIVDRMVYIDNSGLSVFFRLFPPSSVFLDPELSKTMFL